MSDHEPRVSGTKHCNGPSHLQGGVELSVLAFATARRNSDGLHTECRDCSNWRTKHRPPSKARIKEMEIEQKKRITRRDTVLGGDL